MDDSDIDNLRTAIAALQSQRGALGDTVVELAVAPLLEQLTALLQAGADRCAPLPGPVPQR